MCIRMPFKILVDWFHWVCLKRTPSHREELLPPSWILSPVLDTVGLMKIPQTFSLTSENSNLCIKIEDFFWGEEKFCSICSKQLEHKHHRMYRNEGQVFLEVWELSLRNGGLGQWTQELWKSQ